MNKKIWSVYLENNDNQSISSAKTARKQVPRTFKFIKNSGLDTESKVLLDIGCGIGNIGFKEQIETLGVQYNGCDPFNQSNEKNLQSITKCMEGKADFVTLNNVLNTIKEKDIWIEILNQAKNAINQYNGIVFILIYEGNKLSYEKKLENETGIVNPMTPIETRDGWQNRMKTEEYLPFIKTIFYNSEVVNINGIKMIISSPNVDLNLNSLIKRK